MSYNQKPTLSTDSSSGVLSGSKNGPNNQVSQQVAKTLVGIQQQMQSLVHGQNIMPQSTPTDLNAFFQQQRFQNMFKQQQQQLLQQHFQQQIQQQQNKERPDAVGGEPLALTRTPAAAELLSKSYQQHHQQQPNSPSTALATVNQTLQQQFQTFPPNIMQQLQAFQYQIQQQQHPQQQHLTQPQRQQAHQQSQSVQYQTSQHQNSHKHQHAQAHHFQQKGLSAAAHMQQLQQSLQQRYLAVAAATNQQSLGVNKINVTPPPSPVSNQINPSNISLSTQMTPVTPVCSITTVLAKSSSLSTSLPLTQSSPSKQITTVPPSTSISLSLSASTSTSISHQQNKLTTAVVLNKPAPVVNSIPLPFFAHCQKKPFSVTPTTLAPERSHSKLHIEINNLDNAECKRQQPEISAKEELVGATITLTSSQMETKIPIQKKKTQLLQHPADCGTQNKFLVEDSKTPSDVTAKNVGGNFLETIQNQADNITTETGVLEMNVPQDESNHKPKAKLLETLKADIPCTNLVSKDLKIVKDTKDIQGVKKYLKSAELITNALVEKTEETVIDSVVDLNQNEIVEIKFDCNQSKIEGTPTAPLSDDLHISIHRREESEAIINTLLSEYNSKDAQSNITDMYVKEQINQSKQPDSEQNKNISDTTEVTLSIAQITEKSNKKEEQKFSPSASLVVETQISDLKAKNSESNKFIVIDQNCILIETVAQSQSRQNRKSNAIASSVIPEKSENKQICTVEDKNGSNQKNIEVQSPSPSSLNEMKKLQDRKSHRHRLRTVLYQSPLPELAYITKLSANEASNSPKPMTADDKLIVFYKNEYMAVRNAEGTFYLCQTMQNVYRTSPRISIRWLSEDKKNSSIFIPDFYDHTDIECVLTTVELKRIDKGQLRLPKPEKTRIESILKKAIDVEKGIVPRPDITEENPDGLDISLYKDESQIEKRLSVGSILTGRKYRRATNPTSITSKLRRDDTGGCGKSMTPNKKRKIQKRSVNRNTSDEDVTSHESDTEYKPNKKKKAIKTTSKSPRAQRSTLAKGGRVFPIMPDLPKIKGNVPEMSSPISTIDLNSIGKSNKRKFMEPSINYAKAADSKAHESAVDTTNKRLDVKSVSITSGNCPSTSVHDAASGKRITRNRK